MILQTVALSLLFCSVHGFTIQGPFEKSDESSENTIDDDEFSVSTLIEKANANLGKNPDDPLVLFGDIAVPTGLQNADPCTGQQPGCLWPKYSDGNVYIPYRISNQYSPTQRATIIGGLESFAQSSCIRFTPWNGQRDFLDIKSLSGCWSYIGRRGGGQELSLSRGGCIHHGTVQHEMLHALGFHHEHNRSDRDNHVRIQWQNIIPGKESQFRRVINSRNLGTPYDYGSVMHYGRTFFSKNKQPTIVPIPNNNAAIGTATQMSPTDIRRLNILYGCKTFKPDPQAVPRNQPF